ncbi:S8 family peptidase [Anaerocolumna sp. MB42-C2]|uniref:S8 family peptidase n=1 Tax=Anaerocolumna sp. MB42-C2 TaxID=3070997 RepID=UPI0027E13286|nr:S8 family peptidase [Anaerocolumna sp. MB42-C2]WMJ90404.1 S8 family peptidase [Anaerocolumna sp. MB42-C2]
MNEEDRFKIVSNDYADFIVDNITLQSFYSSYSNVSDLRINSVYSVAYIPVTYFDKNVIYNIGYEAIPKCFGLMSINRKEATNSMYTLQYTDYDLSGNGILIGFVDTGIDYRNNVFKYADNSSKITAIWDQTIENGNRYPDGFFYGTEFSREEINAALLSENPMSIVPSMDEVGHGTVLAAIAGGSYDADNNFIGVAPNAEYVVVKLKPAKTNLTEFYFLQQDAICYQENDIILGINYLVQTAAKLNRPIVICLGIGSSQGSHLGEGIFNNYLATMGQLNDVAIIVAAGNEGSSGHHVYGEISPEYTFNDIYLNVGNNNPGFFMEFWGNAPNVFTVDVYTPSDEFVGHVPSVFLQESTLEMVYYDTSVTVDNILENSLGGDQFMLFRIRNPISGTWRFRIISLGNLLSNFNIWLPITNFLTAETYFLNSSPYITITTPGNEKTVLTVTAYNTADQSLYENASKGFTKDNQPKPDITVPGVNILAPGIGNQYMLNTGTSVGAAYASGIVALLQEWGIIKGNQTALPSSKVRSILTIGADRFEDMIYPNPDWGFGIVNLSNSISLAQKR